MKRDKLEKLYETDSVVYKEFLKEYNYKLKENCLRFYESIDFKELENWLKDVFKFDVRLTTTYDIMDRRIKIASQVLNPSDIPLLSYMVKEIWFQGSGEIKETGSKGPSFDFNNNHPLIFNCSISLRYRHHGNGENGTDVAYITYTERNGWEFETVKDRNKE